jgi:hypothetical protein
MLTLKNGLRNKGEYSRSLLFSIIIKRSFLQPEFIGLRVYKYIGCSERRLIGHSFYCRNPLRKSCATYGEKCRRAAPRTEKSDKPAQ